jgi:hypothetical protein
MVPRKNLGKQTKLFFPCRAEIQLPGNGIWLISMKQSSGMAHHFGDFHQIMYSENASYQQQ